MNVLEKILKEIDNHAIEFESFGICDDYVSVGWVKEIIRSNMVEKEEVLSAEIISRDIDGKPYYEIKYRKVGEDHYTVGYSSYKLEYVIEWLNKYFEFCGKTKVVVNNGWIPVEERLPEEKGDITKDFNLFKESLHLITDGVNVTIATFDGGYFRCCDDYVPYTDVTAWQPLPKPYKPKKVTAAGMEHIMSRFTKVE